MKIIIRLRQVVLKLIAKSSASPRQLIFLVLPAFLLGLLLRAVLTIVLPEGYFGDDSGSYYEFSRHLFDQGVVHLDEKRRWFYPLFLAFSDLFPLPGWYLVPLWQHVVGLLTLFGIGWSTAQLVARPRLIVPVVTTFAACWPRTIWYEHEFIAESFLLAAFVGVISLLLTPRVAKSHVGLILLMLAFVLLAGMKGSSRFLWLGSVLALFLLHRDPRRWMWSKLSLALGGLSILLVSTVGESSQGDWLALSSSLPLVRTEGEPYASYRESLKGQISEARSYGDDYPWVVRIYKKRLNRKGAQSFHPGWGELSYDNDEYSRVARAFWVDAVVTKPIEFLSMTTKTIGIALSKRLVSSRSTRFMPRKFWMDMDRAVLSRWDRKPKYFNRLFGMDRSAYVLRRSQRQDSVYSLLPVLRFVSRHFAWLERGPARLDRPIGAGGEGPFPSFSPRPLGVMALCGGVLGVTLSKKRLQCIALLFPLLLYLFGSFAVGDAVSRYLQPVEWIGFVFAGVFLDLVLRFVEILISRARHSVA